MKATYTNFNSLCSTTFFRAQEPKPKVLNYDVPRRFRPGIYATELLNSFEFKLYITLDIIARNAKNRSLAGSGYFD